MMDSGGVPMTMPVQPANTGNNGGGFGWGGDGAWWIIILFLFAFCGWGNGGFGGFGGGFGGNGAAIQGALTRADINDGFAINNLQSGINAIQQGICDASYALNNAIQQGFANTNMGMMQGFNGVQSQICNLGAQLAQCCCDIRSAIQEVNYNMSMQTNMLQNTMNSNTRDIIDSQNSTGRAILDKLCQMEYNGLNDKYQAALAEVQSLRTAQNIYQQNAYLTANNEAQTAELIRRLGKDYPVNAVVVQPSTPVTFPTNCCGQFNGGGWGGNCNQCGNC
ncbi:hypothetical protein V1226_25865 [Lachnospiraceae bacterium JLR.KK009]|nr:hypothetical protein C810_05212 [Lachnospiraceae bacterium A2]